MPHHRSYESHPLRPGASPHTRPLESVHTSQVRQELPSPRDIAVPSIENEAPPYLSHQERTFMQASKESEVELIDLTGTPPREQPRVRPEMHNGSSHSQYSRNPSGGGIRYEHSAGMPHGLDGTHQRDVEVLQHEYRLHQHRRIYEDPAQTRLVRQGVDTQVQSPSTEQVLHRAADRQYGFAELAPRRVEYREPPQYHHPNQLGPPQRAHALIPLDTGRGWDDVHYRARDPPSVNARQIDHDAGAAYIRVGRPAQPQSFHQPFP
ncbi:hypothetical protein HDK77DRAFT_68009 [Phyllosticta capitalensis]|uniref:uncharacterized protein n=1 Tax=Phyllosticta capitalensis TaxID=121624 RepID=UPI00312DEF9E